MSRGALHFASSALLATLVLLLLAFGQRQNDIADLQAQRALKLGRMVGAAAVRGDDEALQAAVAALPGAVEGVREALVLRGAKIVAHSDPARAGKRLNTESDEDKLLYDRAARLRAMTTKNDEERALNPGLTRDAYAEAEAKWVAPDRLVVSVPAEDEGAYKAMAQVETAPVRPDVGLPWLVVVAAVVLAAAFWPLGKKLQGWTQVGAGAAGLALLLLVDGWLMVDWRDGMRHTSAELQAKAVASAASVGLGPAVEAPPAPEPAPEVPAVAEGAPAPDGTVPAAAPTPPPAPPPAAPTPEAGKALAALLAQDEYHVVLGDIATVLKTEAAPAGSCCVAAGWYAEVPAKYYEDGRAQDARSMRQWGLFVLALALAGFTLGSRGKLRQAWDAFVEHRWAYSYLLPAMIGMMLLVFIPMVFGVSLGFAERRYNVFEFVGLANYVQILSDIGGTGTNSFYFTFGVTLMWTVINVGLHVSIGLFLALLLNDQMLKARGIYRVLLIVPWAIPNYITALIWKGMFHKQFGAVNFAMEALGMEPIAWFGSFWPAFTTNVVTNTWLGFPFMMVVSLGALQSIPADLYEAAWVDGANRWQRFRNVTLPLLMPALVPAVIMGFVWTFNMFNIIYLVSGGAPDNKTDILITDAFRWAFERDKYGYAAAYSTLIFFILFGFTLATNKATGATKGVFE